MVTLVWCTAMLWEEAPQTASGQSALKGRWCRCAPYGRGAARYAWAAAGAGLRSLPECALRLLALWVPRVFETYSIS